MMRVSRGGPLLSEEPPNWEGDTWCSAEAHQQHDFPRAQHQTKETLAVQTAQQWLIKLGWQHTLIKKGVYMDGHECTNVVNYHKN